MYKLSRKVRTGNDGIILFTDGLKRTSLEMYIIIKAVFSILCDKIRTLIDNCTVGDSKKDKNIISVKKMISNPN